MIDWSNLPPCTGELVVSPHVCRDDTWYPPPDNPPPAAVPIMGTLPLLLTGAAALAWFRRKK